MKIRRLIAGAAAGALTLALATATPATAAPAEPAADVPTEQTWSALIEATDFESAIRTFDFDEAAANGAEEPFLTEYATGFGSAGGTVLGWDAPATDAKVTESVSAALEVSACNGRNRAWVDGWGWHWEIDSCGATVLSNSLHAGVGVSAAVAAVGAATGYGAPVGMLAAIGGAYALIAGTVVDNCRAPGSGITVHFTAFPWCGAQV